LHRQTVQQGNIVQSEYEPPAVIKYTTYIYITLHTSDHYNKHREELN